MKPTYCNKYLWNSIDVQPPNLYFLESSPSIRNFIKQALNNETSASKYMDLLFLEMATLSKFMIQRKNKYRSEKGFKTIEKIDKVVNRIFNLDLKSAVLLLSLNLSETFVPSKQLCQWLLVKLQSNAKLLQRVIDCCVYSANKLNYRLYTGHNWMEVMVALSMVSRIWSLANFLLENSYKSYNNLCSVLGKLPVNPNEKEWLSETYDLPRDLKNWLRTATFINCSKSEARIHRISDIEKPYKKVKKTMVTIKSCRDLKQFMLEEEKRRSKNLNTKNCVTKHLDALQWHMLKKRIRKWIKILKEAEDKKFNLFVKIIQKKLHLWL